MHADINRECSQFEELSGDVHTRKATSDEIEKYKNIIKNEKRKEKLYDYRNKNID